MPRNKPYALASSHPREHIAELGAIVRQERAALLVYKLNVQIAKHFG
jgi:hypothetical protein